MLNQPRKFTVVWLLFSAVIISIFTILFIRLPGDSMLWRTFQNTGHTPLFGLIAVAILFISRALVPGIRNRPLYGYVIAVAVSLVVGVLTEIGQLLTDRNPSVNDVIRDLIGIVAGLGIYTGIDPKLKPFWGERGSRLQLGTVILSCLLFLTSLLPLVRMATVSIQRNLAFPVIVDFRAGWSRPFLQIQHADLSPVTENRLSRLVLEPARYPGVSMVEPYPDWSVYNSLAFVIYTTQSHPFRLVLRIHDKLHNQEHTDRFNRSLLVLQGENRFRIPLAEIRSAPVGREMVMTQIAGLVIFAVDIKPPVEFFMGPLLLEYWAIEACYCVLLGVRP